MSEPNGQCAVCKFRERHRLEMLLAGGAGLRAVSRKFDLNYHAVRRHWLNHMTEERKAALIAGPVRLSELADRAAEEGGSLMDHLAILRATLYRRLDACDEAGDAHGVSALAGRCIETLREMARLNGDLLRSVNITTNNFYMAPEFMELQAALLQVLSRYPEARADVIRAFRALEAGRTPIEHRGAEVDDVCAA